MSMSEFFLRPVFILIIGMCLHAPVVSQQAPGQQENEATQKTDTIVRFPVEPFIRLGVDVSAIGRIVAEPEVRQLEFSLDSEVSFNWFAVLEGGVLEVTTEQETFSYTSSGYFFRAGFDYNLLGRPTPVQNDLVLLGLRYGFSNLNHEAPFFTVSNPYWGDYSGSMEPSSHSLHWLEFSGGVKTEIFRNLYLGWYLKTRVKLSETKDPDLEPYYIGGFGHGTRRAPVMIHYSILYRFNFR